MQKFLRTLMLAALLLPFASQAQNTLTIADGTTTNSNVPVHGLYVDDYTRCQIIYPAGEIAASATTYEMTGGSISSLTFYLSSPAAASWGAANFEVKLMEVSATTLSAFVDATSATTVYTGALDGTQSTMVITFTTPYTYQGGNLLVEVNNNVTGTYKSASFYGVTSTGASWQGYSSSGVSAVTGSAKNFMPKTTFTFTGGTEITCRPVSNVAIDATQTTTSSLTLTWSDTQNTGATYSVIGADGSVIATGLTTTTYTVTGLDANTAYTFGVVANCSATDAAAAITVSGRTACAAIATLPYTMGFEADDLQGTTNALRLPWCWSRYASGTGSYTYYPYSNTSYVHTGSRALYFYCGTSTSYPDTQVVILPELDVTTYPMNGNRVTFWARMSSASYNNLLYVGTMSDPTDMSTFTLVDTVRVSGATHVKYSIPLTSAAATNAYVAIMSVRNTTANGYMALDDLTLEETPACLEVTGLTASNITSTGVTLSWADADNPAGTTYSVYDMSDTSLVESALTSTTYNVTGLTANTAYVFGVRANCTSGDAPYITIAIRTACEANTVFPWSDDFESYTASSSGVTLNAPCWVNEHITGGGSSLFQVYSSTSGMSGNTTKMLRLPDMSSGTQTKLVLPAMDLPTGSSYQFVIDVLRNATGTSYTSEGVRVYASTDGEITGATELGFLYRNCTQTDNGVVVAETASGWYTYEFTIPFTGTCYIILRGESSYGSATYMDNFIIREVPSCLAVTALTAGNITDNSMTLTWTDGVNTGATYSVYDMSDTTLVQDNITGTTYTVTNLTANTEYTFGVVANCSATDNSYFTTVSGRTACSVETMPWSENFDSWTAKSPCWAFLSGAYNMGAGTPTTTTSGWALQTTYGDYITISGKALAFNLYSTNRYWAVTPSIEMTGDAMFSVDVAVAAWSAATPAYDADDTLAIAISNNNGLTWTNLRVLNNTELNALSGTYTTINVPVNGYTGDTVRFAVFGGSSASGGDNRIAIDNFSVAEPPACMPVTGLTAINIATDSARLTWVGNATSYTILDMADSSIVSTTTDTTYLLENLTAMTQYTYGVVANCGFDNSDTMVVTFATACSAVTVPYTEGFEATSATIGCWSTDGPGNWTIGTGDYSSATGAFEGSLNAKITHSNTGYVTKLISPVLDLNGAAGMQLVFAHIQRDWAGDNDELRVYTREAADSAWVNVATYTAAIETWTVETLNLTGTIYQVAFEMTDNYGYGVGIDSVVFNLPPSCMPVTDVTVDTATATSVTISWTGTAANYSVYNGTAYVANVTTNSYTFTGLTASTGYTFGVVAVCSATDSATMETVAARTDCVGGSCQITINGTDSYGDGWADDYGTAFSTITISQNGATVGTFTLTTGASYSETFQVCSGAPVTFSWTSNSDYDDEAAFQILDGGSAVVYTCADASTLTDGAVFTTIASACPSCMPAQNLTVDSADLTSVSISWTGSAASYDVYNGTTFVATVTTNTYTFTGLTASTSYTFGVQAICSATDSASMATINAMTACADITTLPYLEGFENGLGCWTSVNGSADGVDWNAQPAFSSGSITPHTGNYMAASWSWSGSAMHADAWLISPKFVLPTVAAGDTLNFNWWHITNGSYPDSYSVVLSTTTNDTNAFTTVIRPYGIADSVWTMQSIDLTAYAGQSVYIAFHHVDYNMNYLLIDEISLALGAAPVPDPDTLTVTFAVDDATMGTTTPAPGTYQYITGDTVRFAATANAGYHFDHWVLSFGTQSQSISYQSAYAPASILMSYGDSITLTAYFVAGNPDSTTITYAVNDATLGTITPAPGTYTIYVGDAITASATAYTGAVLSAWVLDIMMNGAVYDSDTITSDDPDFANPMNWGNLPQSFADYNASIVITAIFEDENPGTTYYTVTGVAADTTMGYVLGSNRYVAGSEATLTAVANNGYRFVRWSNGETTATISFTVTENVELTAYFEVSTEGIEDVAAEATVFSTDNKIVVRGAEGQSIYVFDVNGRVMAREANAAESVEFRMETTGVYLVKVGTAAAKRVVVMR